MKKIYINRPDYANPIEYYKKPQRKFVVLVLSVIICFTLITLI